MRKLSKRRGMQILQKDKKWYKKDNNNMNNSSIRKNKDSKL
jgi:hypothetical protein